MIQIENLTKRYGEHYALNNVSFDVKEGEILGFLGPNGAGKSTTMNILTGYISATSGNVKVDGMNILENPEGVKKKIGYLPELPPLYMDMTVKEYLYFVANIKKVKSDVRKPAVKKIMEVTKIFDVKDRLIRNLSKGYRQRVGFAQALIGEPDVLVLDEPTVGLDPKQIIDIRNLVRELGKKHTIILSSHILSEVSAVCDRVLIISKGKIIASGKPEELSAKLNSTNKLQLRIKGPKTTLVQILCDLPDVASVKVLGEKEQGTVDLTVEAKKDKDVREQIFMLMSHSCYPILSMKGIDVNLEQIFLQLTEQERKVK